MYIWPFLLWIAAAFVLAEIARYLSGDLPWTIDDGIKRLMARSWAASGGRSALLYPGAPVDLVSRFFPIPPPFAMAIDHGFRGIFPALFPALGGICFGLAGPVGLYFLPALSLVLLLACFARSFDPRGSLVNAWALLLLASATIFYGMTFWEYPLSLLLLLHLFLALSRPEPSANRWLLIGLMAGLAVYLRPETILLLPLVILVLALLRPANLAAVLRFAAGIGLAFAAAMILEKIWNGRWIPSQAGVNLSLAFTGSSLGGRVERILSFIFNSPLPWSWYAGAFLLLLLLALALKKPWLFVLGTSCLALVSLIWGLVRWGAFTLNIYSQGLFFAWPWAALSLVAGRKRLQEPLFILGWGFAVLLYFLAPDKPGSHWGPRFLLPALIPLLLDSRMALQRTPLRRARWLMALTAAVVLLNGICSIGALALHGHSGREVAAAIDMDNPEILIVDRWHVGADLEPLWGKMTILWAEGPGDLEEMLLGIREKQGGKKLVWLKEEASWPVDSLPFQTVQRQPLPDRGGWRGELLSLRLRGEDDRRWGTLYWHAGRRQAERGNFSGALEEMRRALVWLPESADLHYDLAVTLGKSGRYQEAIAELREALRLNPQHPQALRLWRQLVPR